MKIDNKLNRIIDELMIAENNKRSEDHISSGRLTASSLADPMRFQLLKHLGVPKKPSDTYSLRKFARGRAVEDWLVDKCKTQAGLVIETQKELEYRGVIGLVDMVVDSDLLDFKYGIIPAEIKSVTNANFKWISDKGEIGRHYNLQGAFYALAMGKKQYYLDFVASDDLRIHSVLLETDEMRPEIEKIINNYNQMIELHTIPDWQVSEKWQDNPKYMGYDESWARFSEQEFRNQLKSIGIDW